MKISKWVVIAALVINLLLVTNSFGMEITFKNPPMSPIDSDNGKLVYMSYKNGNFDVFLYDTSTREEKQLTFDPNTQGYPSISGKYVVWMDNRNNIKTNGWFDIHLYNLETGEEKKISQTSGSHEYPDIDGNQIVWEEHSDTLSKIVVYSIETEVVSLVSENAIKGLGPKINGDIVTWTDLRYDNPDVYSVNLKNGLETTIAEGKSIQFGAMVSGDKIVWVDDRNGNMDIFLYDINTKVETQITSSSDDEVAPVIFGNKVVYSTPSKIPLIYDIAAQETTRLNTGGQPVGSFFTVDGELNWTMQEIETSIPTSSGSSGGDNPNILLDQIIEGHTTLKYFNQEKGIIIDSPKGFEKPSRVIVKVLQENQVSPHPGLQLVSDIFSIESSQPMEDGFSIGFIPGVAEGTYSNKLGIYSHDGYKWNYVGGKWLSGGFFANVKDKQGGHYAVFISQITFRDINNHWAQESIEVLAARQIVNGYKEGNFMPEKSVTRAEFSAMLVKALKLTPVKDQVYFKDIPSSHWASGVINVAFANGLVIGKNSIFKPDAPITREEMAVMISRALEINRPSEYQNHSPVPEPPIFLDFNKVSPWARQAVNTATSNGLIKGFQNQFSPQKPLTRAETAVILYRFLELN